MTDQSPIVPPHEAPVPGTQTAPILPTISLWERALRLRDAAVVWLGEHHMSPSRLFLACGAVLLVTFGGVVTAHRVWQHYHPHLVIPAADPPKAAPMPKAKQVHRKTTTARGQYKSGTIKPVSPPSAPCAAFVCGR